MLSGISQEQDYLLKWLLMAGLDPLEMLQTSRDKPLPGIVEQVMNGSVLRLTLLPDFHPINVMVAGVQAPSMGRRPPPPAAPAAAANGEASESKTAASVAAAASSASEHLRNSPPLTLRISHPYPSPLTLHFSLFT